MNDDAIFDGPMAIVLIIVTIVVFGLMGLVAYDQFMFKATATETCIQIMDREDFHTESVRDGNFVNERIVYHIYDTCKDRNGTITKNASVGYGSENEALLYGLMKR